MTSDWTQESVLRLAPDAGSAKAGRDLATARKWTSSNANASTIWGLCQGSGSKPYQTIVDLTEPAFKCSCPSRKFPCKHGLGLLLLFAGDQKAFVAAEPPAWVNEWITGRAQRAAKKTEAVNKPAEPVDAAAQVQRREKRLERITEGLSSLRTWLDDLIRQGIAVVPSRGYSFFDEPARRMIDAQAPGVARMIQALGTTANSGAGWHGSFLRQLGSVHSLLKAVEQLADLPLATQDDVMAAIGVPISQEEVLARPGVTDTWQLMSQEVEFEQKLRVQRTWLFGVTQRRPALVLHFAHGTGPMDGSFVVGTEFQGELCVFPGSSVRAVVKSREAGRPISILAGYETLDAACDAYSLLLAAQPWLESVVLPIRQVIPVNEKGNWKFIDSTGAALPARMSSTVAWRTMAASGGNLLDLCFRFDGQMIEPLTVTSEGKYISVVGSHTEGTALAG